MASAANASLSCCSRSSSGKTRFCPADDVVAGIVDGGLGGAGLEAFVEGVSFRGELGLGGGANEKLAKAEEVGVGVAFGAELNAPENASKPLLNADCVMVFPNTP